jgi:superfamily II DNA or RNA helicase
VDAGVAIPGDGTWLALRPYQAEALDAVEAAEHRGVRRQVVALPTGTGKTVVFSHLIHRRGGRALVLAHRDELVGQAVDKLTTVDPGAEVGIVKAERDEIDAAVVVASVQTLAQPRRLARITGCQLRRPPGNFELVVVDEAHHALADTYRRVLNHLGCLRGQPGGPLLVGFTATPERGDGGDLSMVFDQIVYTRTLEEMIAAGYLVDLRAIQVRLDVSFAGLHVRAGEFVSSEVENYLLAADAPRHAAAAWHQHAHGRRGLVFTPTVATAHAMAEASGNGGWWPRP